MPQTTKYNKMDDYNVPVLRENIIKDYCEGICIPKIITSHRLYKESEFDGKWRRMRKAEIEDWLKIDFHMERSKSINKALMEQLKQQTC